MQWQYLSEELTSVYLYWKILFTTIRHHLSGCPIPDMGELNRDASLINTPYLHGEATDFCKDCFLLCSGIYCRFWQGNGLHPNLAVSISNIPQWFGCCCRWSPHLYKTHYFKCCSDRFIPVIEGDDSNVQVVSVLGLILMHIHKEESGTTFRRARSQLDWYERFYSHLYHLYPIYLFVHFICWPFFLMSLYA